MRVLVTGASGYLGGCVAARLAAEGHEVRAFVRDPARFTAPAQMDVAPGDVLDPNSLAVAAVGCEVIVHCAAMVKNWAKDRSEFDRVNVGGLRNVLAAAKAKGTRVLYTSSFLALGETDGGTLDEDSPAPTSKPRNDYERTKRAADGVAREAAAAGMPIVCLYPGVVYGPGALTAGNHVVQNLLLHARGKLPGMLGPGDRRMSLAFVDDVTSGFAAALTRGKPGRGYILGGDNRTLVELFDAFRDATGIAPPRLKIPYAAARGIGLLQRLRAEVFGTPPELTDEVVNIYGHEWAYSSVRAIEELGYRITPLRDGIAKTVAWLRAQGQLPEHTA